VDSGTPTIRKITSNFVVSTYAGSATSGSANGIGTYATFNGLHDLHYSGGNLIIADASNNLIRIISPTAVVTTFAGSTGGLVNGIGTYAKFNGPWGVAADSLGNIYVADATNNVIRKITTAATVSTYAGTSTAGSANGLSTLAGFNQPGGVIVDYYGNVFVADRGNNKIRKIDSTGLVSTLAGSGTASSVNSIGTYATFNLPVSLTIDSNNNVFVSDYSGHVIRKVRTSNGVVTTIAGSGASGNANGIGTLATFTGPHGLCFDPSTGNLYVVDYGGDYIRAIKGAYPTSQPSLQPSATPSR
jgi:sugar lactone lactonase YvrE